MAVATPARSRRSWRSSGDRRSNHSNYSKIGAILGSTVGLKGTMGVTGILLGAFVVAHMVGNLKFFEGPGAFNGYARWLRHIGSPVLGPGWYLWTQRLVLLACVVAHIAAAVTLTRRDRAARPVRYRHRRWRPRATHVMRWGGAIIGVFLLYHILDTTVGTLNPGYVAGDVYRNVAADFRHWYVTAAYTAAVLAVGLHLRHGLWSAARSLGGRLPKAFATGVAVAVTAGFLAVPLSVQLGLI